MTSEAGETKPQRVPFVYKPLSMEQLEVLAQDIASHKVFHSGLCQDWSETAMIFLPLALMDGDQLREMQQQQVVMFYEYVSKAREGLVKGLPAFFSVQTLDKAQATIVQDKIREIYSIEDAIRKVEAEAEAKEEA